MVEVLFVVITSAERSALAGSTAIEDFLLILKNSSSVVRVHRVGALVKAIGLVVDEDLALAEIAPDALRRKVHLHRMTRRLKQGNP